MKRILVTGAGGAPTTNFVRSLRDTHDRYHLVGVDCNPFKISLAETDEKYLVPKATDKDYISVLKDIVKEFAVEFIHAQPWIEVLIISKNRNKLGAMVFLPDHSTVELCTDKYKSYLKWKASNLKVPKTSLIRNEKDLRKAFDEYGPSIWLREIEGAAGAGGAVRSALPALPILVTLCCVPVQGKPDPARGLLPGPPRTVQGRSAGLAWAASPTIGHPLHARSLGHPGGRGHGPADPDHPGR